MLCIFPFQKLLKQSSSFCYLHESACFSDACISKPAKAQALAMQLWWKESQLMLRDYQSVKVQFARSKGF
jgi:hypothetical protein